MKRKKIDGQHRAAAKAERVPLTGRDRLRFQVAALVLPGCRANGAGRTKDMLIDEAFSFADQILARYSDQDICELLQ